MVPHHHSKDREAMLVLMKITQRLLLYIFIFITAGSMAQEQLIISEIMANPSNGRLPDAEFIELYNPGETTVHLKDYALQVNDTYIGLLEHYLAPKQFMLLVDARYSDLFERFGNVMSLPSWKALNNSGAQVSIVNSGGEFIDKVSYTDKWYLNSTKRNGGWSLERINPNIPCDEALNWQASDALNGGTPGQRNSTQDTHYLPDLAPSIINIHENTITLQFSPKLHVLPEISLEQAYITPIDNKIGYIERKDSLFVLHFDATIPSDTPCELILQNVKWCDLTYQFSLPLFHYSVPQYNDIVINEVLFNPKADGVDFVELYNRSGKIINLQGWFLGNKSISAEPYLFYPSTYCVLTTSPAVVKRQYPTTRIENCLTMSSLPPYANERGYVVLSHGLEMIDSLAYLSSMHQPFLKDVKGISLERQAFSVGTNEPNSFISASTLVGGATPGYKNSKNVEKKIEQNSFILKSRTFSPNGDGFEDELYWIYRFSEKSPMLTLLIFDDKGRVINRLIRNNSAGKHGEIGWNGEDENGQPCPGGIYLFQAEMHTAKGRFQTFKGSFVLVRD